MDEPQFDEIWSRIDGLEGQIFHTKTGLEFTYIIAEGVLKPSRTDYKIGRADFETAYKKVPLGGPGEINQIVRGPSYVWAILHDQRISNGDW